MAATYYSQLLHAYRWEEIARDCDVAINTLLREHADDPNVTEVYGHGHAFAEILPDDEDTIRGAFYLGRTYLDSPSGSFYAPWSAIPERVRDADERWFEAFERAAEKYGLSIDSGEGDPTDTYAVKYADVSA